MTLFDRIAENVERDSGFTRKIFVGKLGKAGAVLAVGLGGLTSASTASATRNVACCVLAYDTDCPNPDTCQACQSRWIWTCYDSGTNSNWECIECYYAGTCAGCSYAKRIGIAPPKPTGAGRL